MTDDARKKRWNGGNGNPSSRAMTSANEYTFEYTLSCGDKKRRKPTPPTRVGDSTFCWDCGAQRVVVDREVVFLTKSRRS